MFANVNFAVKKPVPAVTVPKTNPNIYKTAGKAAAVKKGSNVIKAYGKTLYNRVGKPDSSARARINAATAKLKAQNEATASWGKQSVSKTGKVIAAAPENVRGNMRKAAQQRLSTI